MAHLGAPSLARQFGGAQRKSTGSTRQQEQCRVSARFRIEGGTSSIRQTLRLDSILALPPIRVSPPECGQPRFAPNTQTAATYNPPPLDYLAKTCSTPPPSLVAVGRFTVTDTQSLANLVKGYLESAQFRILNQEEDYLIADKLVFGEERDTSPDVA